MKAMHTLLAAACAAAALSAHAEPGGADLQRGRYLLQIGGCNDCHTAGYAMSGGKVPEAQWVAGDALGWQGPWGTTYPVNLRLYMQGLSEDQWVKKAKGMVTRPPMPWFALRDMNDDDLRAMYRFIRSVHNPVAEVVHVDFAFTRALPFRKTLNLSEKECVQVADLGHIRGTANQEQALTHSGQIHLEHDALVHTGDETA